MRKTPRAATTGPTRAARVPDLGIWTYLVFASDRLDFAAAERSTAVLTATEKDQFTAALHIDDPQWILNLVIFAVLLLSAFFSRLREINRTG